MASFDTKGMIMFQEINPMLKKYTTYVGIVFLIVLFYEINSRSPTTVTLSSDIWECKQSDTIGIFARCTDYRMIIKPTVVIRTE